MSRIEKHMAGNPAIGEGEQAIPVQTNLTYKLHHPNESFSEKI